MLPDDWDGVWGRQSLPQWRSRACPVTIACKEELVPPSTFKVQLAAPSYFKEELVPPSYSEPACQGRRHIATPRLEAAAVSTSPPHSSGFPAAVTRLLDAPRTWSRPASSLAPPKELGVADRMSAFPVRQQP